MNTNTNNNNRAASTVLCIGLTLALLFASVPAMSAAASLAPEGSALMAAADSASAYALTKKNAKAHKAYENAMIKGKVYGVDGVGSEGFYYYRDVNKDGYDELILWGYIWTYYKGKAKRVWSSNGDYFIYPKTRVIHVAGMSGTGYGGERYLKLSKGKIKTGAKNDSGLDESTGGLNDTYYKNGKKISKAAYGKYAKSLRKGKKITPNYNKGFMYVAGSTNECKYEDWYAGKKATYLIAVRAKTTDTFSIWAYGDGSSTESVKFTLYDSKMKKLSATQSQGNDIFSKLKKGTTYYLKVTATNANTAARFSIEINNREAQM
jgi:hypothetical protein